MRQVYIHGNYPGGNELLKRVFNILGYDQAVSANDFTTDRQRTRAIIESEAFYTNRVVETEFEWQLADNLGLDIISNQKLQTLMIDKLVELSGGLEDGRKE